MGPQNNDEELTQRRKLKIASFIALFNGTMALGWVIFLMAYSTKQDTLLVRFVLAQSATLGVLYLLLAFGLARRKRWGYPLGILLPVADIVCCVAFTVFLPLAAQQYGVPERFWISRQTEIFLQGLYFPILFVLLYLVEANKRDLGEQRWSRLAVAFSTLLLLVWGGLHYFVIQTS